MLGGCIAESVPDWDNNGSLIGTGDSPRLTDNPERNKMYQNIWQVMLTKNKLSIEICVQI